MKRNDEVQSVFKNEKRLKQTFSIGASILCWIVALEVFIYFGAAYLHLGLPIRLGSLVLAVPNAIVPATIVETILGLAVIANLVVLLRGNRRSKAITVGVHLFLLVGVLFGVVALLLRVGPPPSADWTLHYVMLDTIVVVLVLDHRSGDG